MNPSTGKDQPGRPSYQLFIGVLGAGAAIVAAIISILPWLSSKLGLDDTPSVPKGNGQLVDKPEEAKQKGTLTIKQVEVAKTDASGKSWDVSGGKPDLLVEVKNLTSGRSHLFPSAKDTLSLTLDAYAFPIRENDTVRITVYDQDGGLSRDDKIGSTTFTVTADKLQGKTEELRFDQVVSLEVSFETVK